MARRVMYEISVDVNEDFVSLSSPDVLSETGEATVSFSIDQAEILIKWIREAIKESKAK